MIETVLNERQIELLEMLVEAERKAPRDHEGFRGPTYGGISQITLYHAGLPEDGVDVSGSDAYALAEEGFVTILRTAERTAIRIHLNPAGVEYVRARVSHGPNGTESRGPH